MHRDEGGSERDTDVEHLRQILCGLRHLGEQPERGLEQPDGFSIGGLSRRLFTGLPKVPHRLGAEPCTRRVMRKHLHLLVQPIGVQPLDCLDDRSMQSASAILQQAA